MNTEYDYLFKFLIIGDSGVGKSALMSRFVDNTFTDYNMPTIGVDFRIQDIFINDKQIKLQIWDTSGQERFKSITSSYYKGAHCILVVYDITDRESFVSIQRWMEQVDQHAPNDVLILLIGNKSDNEQQRTITDEEGVDMAQHYAIKFLETSAKSNNNVLQTFKTAANDLIYRINFNNTNKADKQKKSLSLGNTKQLTIKPTYTYTQYCC